MHRSHGKSPYPGGAVVRAQDSLTFPKLKRAEIVQELALNGCPITVEVLKKPTPADVRHVFEFFVHEFYGKRIEDFSQPSFGCLDELVFPELHTTSVTEIGFFTQCQELFEMAQYGDFGLMDLYSPTSPRFVVQLSALLNLHRFRSERAAKYQELMSLADGVSAAHKEMSERVAELAAEKKKKEALIAADEPEVAKRKEVVTELTVELNRLREQQVSLTSEVRQMKKTRQSQLDKITSATFRRNDIQAEVEKLKERVVSSPERVKAEIEEKAEKLENEKGTVLGMQRRTRELNLRVEALNKVNRDLEPLNRLIAETDQEMERTKGTLKSIKSLRTKLAERMNEKEEIKRHKFHLENEQIAGYEKRVARVKQQRSEVLDRLKTKEEEMLAERREAEQKAESVQQQEAEEKARTEELLLATKELKEEYVKELEGVLRKQKGVASDMQKFFSDFSKAMKFVGDKSREGLEKSRRQQLLRH